MFYGLLKNEYINLLCLTNITHERHTNQIKSALTQYIVFQKQQQTTYSILEVLLMDNYDLKFYS